MPGDGQILGFPAGIKNAHAQGLALVYISQSSQCMSVEQWVESGTGSLL